MTRIRRCSDARPSSATEIAACREPSPASMSPRKCARYPVRQPVSRCRSAGPGGGVDPGGARRRPAAQPRRRGAPPPVGRDGKGHRRPGLLTAARHQTIMANLGCRYHRPRRTGPAGRATFGSGKEIFGPERAVVLPPGPGGRHPCGSSSSPRTPGSSSPAGGPRTTGSIQMIRARLVDPDGPAQLVRGPAGESATRVHVLRHGHAPSLCENPAETADRCWPRSPPQSAAMATACGPCVISVKSASSGAGHRRRRYLRRISRRNPMATRPTAKTSHGTRISRLVAVTVASLTRRILGSLASFPAHRVMAYGG